jgi:Domain of unknown function (DUF4439)
MSRQASPVSALQAALTAEHAAVYGYGVIGAHLTGSRQSTATSDWVAHQEARDKLEAMLQARDAQPVAAAVAYRLPVQVRTPAQAASLAVLLEERITTAYLGLVAQATPAVRTFGAQQVQVSALRAAYWRGSTVAFPGLPASALAAPRRSGG